MSAPDDFSFSDRNKRAKPRVDAPPPGQASEQERSEYKAPPPRDSAPPPRDFTPPPRDFIPPPAPEPATTKRKSTDDEDEDFELPIDPWRLASALKARWRWMLIAAAGLLVVGGIVGYLKSSYKLTITLIQRDVSARFEAGMEGESFKPHELSSQTLVALMGSPQLVQTVAEKARPPISARNLRSAITVLAGRDTDLVALTMTGSDKEALVDLANLYANEAVRLTRDQQLEELSRMNKFYRDKAAAAFEEIEKANNDLVAFQKNTGLINPTVETESNMKALMDLNSLIYKDQMETETTDLQITNLLNELQQQNPVAQRLRGAQDKLAELLRSYTEAWPEVQNLRRQIGELEQQIATSSTNAVDTSKMAAGSMSSTIYLRLVELRSRKATLEKEMRELDRQKKTLEEKMMTVSENGARYAMIKARLDSLQKTSQMLANRQRVAQLYESNAEGYYRVFAPATLKDVDSRSRLVKALLMAAFGAALGLLGTAAVIATLEAVDDRLKTAADVKRVTGLPVLASLGDLNQMTPAEKETWAFRAWTALSGQLSRSANHGLVCGFISSTHGEGRSTWINLLVDAASQRGLRVLTISTRPSPGDIEEMEKAAAESEQAFSDAVAEAVTEAQPHIPATAVTMTAQALAFPAEVSQKFSGPNAVPSAHIALPGWVWNLDRRKQFQRALAHWRSIESMVLLVELPPASVPEAVLLAENLPQLIWLVDSGKPRARATREQLETLRHAKCRLVGAVLNHEPKPVLHL